MSIVVEEADETFFWLELLHEAEIITLAKIKPLLLEYEEIVKIANTISVIVTT
ncbi:hypothetical protein [Pedobacter sp.]|uniref:hypothetical protein n=1 Tax=Pedobacter sp. TaxID=1411316 RepID=UPI003D7F2CB0